MEKTIKLKMENMSIVHYENGNMNKYVDFGDVRPVCALMLASAGNQYHVKVLFKGNAAVEVFNYIKNRKLFGEIEAESVDVTGYLREIRNGYVVVDNLEHLYFTPTIRIKIA